MHGQAEKLFTANDGRVVEICRGDAGAAVINMSDKEQKVKMPTVLADGVYADKVYGNEFRVKKGMLEGRMSPMTSYILYSK